MVIPKGGDAYTASVYMNFVYDPKVAAKLAAYINYVTPVKGAKEELAKTDPETANNQLIFPTEETLSQVHLIDPAALKNSELPRAVAGRARRLTARHWASSTVTAGSRRTSCSRRGWRGWRCSSSSRSGSSPTSRSQSGTFDVGLRVRLGLGQLLGRAPALPRAAHPVARLRGARDGVRAPHQLPARVLDRVPRRALEEPPPGHDHRPVLRHVPDQDARVADDPRRRGPGRRHLPRRRDPRRRRPRCSQPRPPSWPGSPTTSCPSWRCRSTCRSRRSTSG